MCLNKRNNSYITAFIKVHVLQHRELYPYTEHVFHVVKLLIGSRAVIYFENLDFGLATCPC